ncbi:MAG TPA: thioredoxin TrxC [Tepidisphaeraceae bacterium]|nr:thioredoxin TrxC [Tepidisphaeraceae bacterium]
MATIITCSNCGAKNRVDERAGNLQPVCGKCRAKLPAPQTGDGHPITVTDANFEQVISDSRPVLVDFWATWCPPCRAIAPVLEQLATEANGRYVIGKLDVDQNQQIAGQFHIEGIPTLLIFKNGKLVDRLVGAHPKQTISQHLQAQV